MPKLPLWQRLTNRKKRRAALYRRYRAFRYPNAPEIIPTASECWEVAKLVERWERWESAGWVRLQAVPDEDAEREEGEEGEAYGSVRSIRLRDSSNPTRPIGDPEDKNGWQHADSVWGHIGYRDCLDPLENPYTADVMRATLKAAQEERYAAFEQWANEPHNAAFVAGYVECIFFTSQGDRDDPIPKTMDQEIESFGRESRLRIWEDCERFYRLNRRRVDRIGRHSFSDGTYDGPELAGHNFWLSRNGHGAGFWDADYIRETDRQPLHDSAKRFGECDVYRGDTGYLYLS